MYTHLVVEVGLECELAVADEAPEAARVEEGVVLERADLVGGVDRLAAPEAAVLHVHLAAAEHFRACLTQPRLYRPTVTF